MTDFLTNSDKNLPKSNRADCISRTGQQLVNSTELPGHDNMTTVMSKVSCCVSEILPQPHEEEVIQISDTPETPDEDKGSMTRVMFKNIMTKALVNQC